MSTGKPAATTCGARCGTANGASAPSPPWACTCSTSRTSILQPTFGPSIIPVRVAGIHLSNRSSTRGWLDTGDKPRYDNCVRLAGGWHANPLELEFGQGFRLGTARAAAAEGRGGRRPGDD